MAYLELRCPACSATELCGPDEVVHRLRAAGKLRGDGRVPEPEIIDELFRAVVPALRCAACGHRGLAIGPASDDDEDWPEAPRCDLCGGPIPAERVAALPGVRRCAACQQREESGEGPVTDEIEYCPRCGAPMELRPGGGAGVTRYIMVCTGNPPCRGRR